MDKKKLLIVDDDPDILELLVQTFEEFYDVKSAENGKEGLEIFKTHNPDVTITDLLMPVMDGIEFIREIKKIRNPSIICVSSGASDEFLDQAKKEDVYKIISKPFDPYAILNEISNALKSQKTS